MHPQSPEQIHKLFSVRGLRCTRQRLAIYQALAATQKHPTAEELFRLVSNRIRGLSLATVYNTVEAFCHVGLALKLPGCSAVAGNNGHRKGNGPARYDAAVENHIHLRCLNTGCVADLPDELGRLLLSQIDADLLRQVEQQMGFKLERVHIELLGKLSPTR